MLPEIESFDLIAYLDSVGVEYRREGKNISTNWLGVRCPFCPDPSFHLGINLQRKTLNCWRCGPHGTIINFIMEMERCQYNKAKKILHKFQDPYSENLFSFDSQLAETLNFPKEATKNLSELSRKYLRSRNFDPDYLSKYYDLYSCDYFGDYAYRIIIPVYQNQEMVAFVGRDATNQAFEPYKNSPIEDSTVPLKSCLYNIDRVRRGIGIVVEGIFDVWRIGDGAIATFGTEVTKEQIRLLSRLNKVCVLFDSEEKDKNAPEQADRLAYNLSGGVEKVEVLYLSKGDPADMDLAEVAMLRSIIFGR